MSSFDHIPEGFVSTVIPASEYQIFSVEKGSPEKIAEKWREIWQHNFEKKRTFLLEFERYKQDGDIDIFIGVE